MITLPQPPFAIETSDRSETTPRARIIRRNLAIVESLQASRRAATMHKLDSWLVATAIVLPVEVGL